MKYLDIFLSLNKEIKDRKKKQNQKEGQQKCQLYRSKTTGYNQHLHRSGKVSRQGLRSSRPEDNISSDELAEDKMEQSELNQTIVEALEAQQTKIMAGMNAEEGRREECRESERGLNIKYILSEFQGGTSLIRYMNQLNQYWEAVKPRDNDTHYLTERSLSEPPGVWWQIIKDEVSNLQTFLNKFSRRFCKE